MTIDLTIARAEVSGLPPDRLGARVLAHALIEQVQASPRPGLVERLAKQARARGWGEVQVLLLHSQLIGQSLRGETYATIRDTSDEMLGAAESTEDEIFLALAQASRALFVVDADNPGAVGEDAVGLLANAVAMLDEAVETDPDALGLRAVELPACFVECGQAYHRLEVWEVEEEMYVRAAAALRFPLPPQVRPVGGFTRRALVVNRLESATALACALLEIGEREGARQVAGDAVRPTRDERDDLPPAFELVLSALEHLLDVIAGKGGAAGDPTAVPADLYDRLGASTWPGYRACLPLAAAIAARDAGDAAWAARLAEGALALLDGSKPSIAAIALHLAAQVTRDEAALRYSRHLAALRWQTHLAVLGAVRSRLVAARVLRQGEQLSRQAYVDALTGLANRHAETRHLARLRRRGPRERLGVVLVDVDLFKAVNDTFGHAVGDEVLRTIGMLLQAATRGSDLAVRLGGDEFMLLADLPPGADIPDLADGVVRAVTKHRWTDIAPGLRVSVSAGQAVGAACDVDELVRAADENLYRAKGAGRGRAVAVTGAG